MIYPDYRHYYDGNSTPSYDDVLWSPGSDPRTDSNYPVVPTEIDQAVHSVTARYRYDEHWSMTVVLPYIEPTADHMSVVPDYDNFVIKSRGVGDIVALPSYGWSDDSYRRRLFSLGVTLPTGSIDEEGDTSRASGDQQLPYTMQLGSATYDAVGAFSLQGQRHFLLYGAQLSGKLRLHESDRDYTLGSVFNGSAWLGYEGWRGARPSLALRYWRRGHISGEDSALRVPNPAVHYPAAVVDPVKVRRSAGGACGAPGGAP